MPRPSGFLVWFPCRERRRGRNAVLPVIDAIAADHPEIRLLLQRRRSPRRSGPGAAAKGARTDMCRLDNQDYVRRFLDDWQPDLAGVLVESEIWPNLVLETNALNVPLVLVNGRMSFRSFPPWRNRPGLSRPLFSAFGLVLARTALRPALHRARRPARRPVGNRVDAPPPAGRFGRPQEPLRGARRTQRMACGKHASWRGRHRRRRPSAMKGARPDLLTIIVPRHPDRGPFIARLL